MLAKVFLSTLLFWGCLTLPDGICQNLEINPTRVYEGSNNILFELKPKTVNPYSQFYYIQDEFSPGNILLFDSSSIANLPMRYDIMRNRMEILVKDETKVLYARKIISFEWFNTDFSKKSVFVNCREYQSMDQDIRGFFEILAKGTYTLLSHSELKIFTNTSSVSVSGSHRSSNIFKKENFFMLKDKVVTPLPKKRKRILALMSDRKEEVTKYVRKKGLLFNRKKDLVAIFDYYNTLTKEEQ